MEEVRVEVDKESLAKRLKAMLDEAYMTGYTIAKEEANQERLLKNADILARAMVNGECKFTMEQPDGGKAGYVVTLAGYEFADIS